MGFNNLLTNIKLYYKILYFILILFYQKIILILFNISDHIKSKNEAVKRIESKHLFENPNMY